MADAFASLARSLSAERRPRMSAMQSSLPWAVSKTFVWVFTWYCGLGFGEAVGRVEVEAGRERDCILEETSTADGKHGGATLEDSGQSTSRKHKSTTKHNPPLHQKLVTLAFLSQSLRSNPSLGSGTDHVMFRIWSVSYAPPSSIRGGFRWSAASGESAATFVSRNKDKYK